MATSAEMLVELVQPNRLTAVVDAGIGPASPDTAAYRPMLDKRLCSLIALDPQLDPRTPPNLSRNDLETFLPYAVGDGASATLKLCRAPGMNSMLTPDPRMLQCFGLYADYGAVGAEKPVETRRLDDIAEITALDFLKIDMQGSERPAFHGGRSRLTEAVAVQVEVCFMPLYKEQPLFADIDADLRGLGFIPHIFDEVTKALIQPLSFTDSPNRAINHGLFCDMVYVRDFSRIEKMTVNQLKHLALIAHYCFRSFDLACKCMVELIVRGETASDAIERYLGTLNLVPSR